MGRERAKGQIAGSVQRVAKGIKYSPFAHADESIGAPLKPPA